MPDVRWPREWEADTSSTLPCVRSRACRSFALVQVAVPADESGPDIDGLIARLRLDPAEAEALRWLAKVVETSETWLKSKSGLQPKAILSALDKWRRVRDGAALAERGGDCG